MTEYPVEPYHGQLARPPVVVDAGGYQPPYPHPAYQLPHPPPGYPPAYPHPGYQPVYPHPGYPVPAPEMPADRLYYVNGTPHVRAPSGNLVALHPPKSHLHRNPWVVGYAGLIVVACASAGLFIIGAALYALVGAVWAHLVQIGATLAVMVLVFLIGAGAMTKMRHGHKPVR